MKSGILLIILGLVIIMSAGMFALYASLNTLPEEVACTLEAKTCPDGTVVGREGPACEFALCPDMTSSQKAVFSWSFTELAVDAETGTPKTRVMLSYNNETYDLGIQDGSCSAIGVSSWEMLPNEQDGAICYFAGAGVEFGIFLENTSRILKQGVIDEGSAELGGFRGDFIPLFVLN